MAQAQPETKQDKPAAALPAPADQAVTQEQLATLLAKLEAAEARAKRLQDENDLLQGDNQSGLRLSQAAKPYAGEAGGYKFKIGPLDPEKYPHLKTVVEHAVDESEIKRWYAATNEHPPGSKKRLDLLKVKLSVICIDVRRDRLINHRKRLAAIRAKQDAGSALNSADEATLELTDDQVLNPDRYHQNQQVRSRR